ncbi:MAG: 3-oxoacyl-acyl-carrier-protein synthase III [Bacteroidetes bacterium]|nr:MAG: 3-oxoacyl-acyl-carrier-protein synthase III [Bacteroidota bacterium]
MHKQIYSIISGTGSYLPTKHIPNADFLNSIFYESTGEKINRSNEEIISKFQQITGIDERRYVEDDFVSSDIAFFAAEKAIANSGIDKEELDYIIVAHNFGDVKHGTTRVDIVPAIAARVKHKLGILNPFTVAYDLPFGCPGWLQAVIQANYYIRSGDAKKILVIGSETLSRVSDPHDRDSMIYSDGAGAVVLSAVESEEPVGILTHVTRTDTFEQAFLLRMDKSYNPEKNNELYLKMNGRKLYEYALKTVPAAIKMAIDKSGLPITDIERILIHQANEKMDDAIVNRLYELYGVKDRPEFSMPMTISWLGNNSVATLPILFDLIVNQRVDNHQLNAGDHFVFASVGAGMHVNALVYKMPG